MADIDHNTALLIALISTASTVVGGLISSGTNYLIEWRKSRIEEKKLDQEKKYKELERRNELYIKFLKLDQEDMQFTDEDDHHFEDPSRIDDLSISVITYGSPKVSTLMARSFPFKNWETIEAVKRLIMAEIVLEKGGRLSLTAGTEYKELDAYMGKKI
ncbi:MAG: hypothetical protein FNP40_00060 [Dehalobacter sp. 4CP]|jgi:hypothetical protein|nr:hypothetical protein [Dehalobacter sp. 4CP]